MEEIAQPKPQKMNNWVKELSKNITGVHTDVFITMKVKKKKTASFNRETLI